MWCLWNNRNQWIWNNERKDEIQLGAQASHMWNEWYSAQSLNNNIATDEQVQQQVSWSPPRQWQGWLNCNVDAGLHNEGRIISGGWCIRNDVEQFIRTRTNWRQGGYSIIEVEALALLEAMLAACDQNLKHVIFESDAQVVVEAIHTNHIGVSVFKFRTSF
jgi:hypothetical protein